LIDAISTRLFEFVLAVPAGEQPDAERPGAACGQEIPHAVADHDRDPE
jgi:hypothetical protein